MNRLAELSTCPEYFRWDFLKNPTTVTFKMWYEEKYWVWDSDNCGNCTSFWVWIADLGPPLYYKVEHSWWHTLDDTDAGWINEVEITAISKAALLEDISKVDKYTREQVEKNLKFIV